MNISIHSCKYCKWAYKIIWNCAINIASCFVWEGIKDIWGLGVSLGSDFNLPWNWSYNIAIYVQIPKFENWITWFMGTCISYKWCLKNPSTCKYECNQTQGGGRIGDRPVYRKWSVYTYINIKIQWNKVWSTAVPNNSRHDDGTLHVEAGLMMVFPSKSYFGYKKTKPFNCSSCVCANCLCKEVCLCVVSI